MQVSEAVLGFMTKMMHQPHEMPSKLSSHGNFGI